MTDVPPPQPPEEREPETAPLPSWVPTLIGAVLVILAGLAVYTGLQYRNSTIVGVVKPRRVPAANSPAPPGEPQPGASLVFPGESGDNAPVAHPAVSGKSRATIVGTGHDVESTVRIWARRGMTTAVTPPDALVYVNDVAVGEANQLSSQPYEFPIRFAQYATEPKRCPILYLFLSKRRRSFLSLRHLARRRDAPFRAYDEGG